MSFFGRKAGRGILDESVPESVGEQVKDGNTSEIVERYEDVTVRVLAGEPSWIEEQLAAPERIWSFEEARLYYL